MLVLLCVREEMELGLRQALDPALHPSSHMTGPLRSSGLQEPLPNPEGSQEVTLPRDWRTQSGNGH